MGVPYENQLVPTDFETYLYVPISLACWYLAASILLAAKRWIVAAATEDGRATTSR